MEYQIYLIHKKIWGIKGKNEHLLKHMMKDIILGKETSQNEKKEELPELIDVVRKEKMSAKKQ